MTKHKKSHIGPHKYQQVKWGSKGTVVWRCVLRDCTHYLHPEFIEGKQSICWKCGQSFIITKVESQRTKPKCGSCVGRTDSVMELINSLMGKS